MPVTAHPGAEAPALALVKPVEVRGPIPAPGRPQPPLPSARVFWIAFIFIALTGVAARIRDTAAWRKTGFDELLYRRYVNLMDGGTQALGVFQRDQSLQQWEFKVRGTGAGAMPSLTSLFLRTQAKP